MQELKCILPSLCTMNDASPVRTPDDWRARRRELIEILSREEYGFTPAAPDSVRAEALSSERGLAGKATLSRVRLSFDTPGGEFSFPIHLAVPEGRERVPAFVFINFRPDVPDQYMPLEEIIDRGYAVASFYYKDVTDDSPALDGLAAMYPIDPETGWGKIGMWAFAASRVMDYLETLPCIDPSRVAVTGHSRLGKTSLWCGAQDERFSMVISNDSGCSGAAISRGKVGESIRHICTNFPFWFCGNYRSWMDREFDAPFDQHFLLALAAPRALYVCSAVEDEWSDPASEYRGVRAASEAWSLLRRPGLIGPDALPAVGSALHAGSVAYHLRSGGHFFSRTDWNEHMDYRDRHGV